MSENNTRGVSAEAATGQADGSWPRQVGFLGAALAVAAAVIAAGLMFAPRSTAYSGISPWVVSALVGFLLVLGGACVVFAASLAATTPPREPAAPAPVVPDGAFPDGSFPAGTFPAGTAPVGAAPGGGGQGAKRPGRPATRGLTVFGAVLGAAGLVSAALAVALAALLPSPTENISVQFTDLYGRVQLEYCPTLPASFEATASQHDLLGSSTILPVRVTPETCGNADYTDGVWIYLNRDAVTVSDRP
jgi:hypothetical protein